MGEERVICFYHDRDFDGVCSGAIVKHFNPDCELYGIDYGDEFPWHLAENQDVVMCDYSLQPTKDMMKLSLITNRLTWIDHHKTAIQDAEKLNLQHIPGIRKVGTSACELAWEYYSNISPPIGVTFLGRYDVWDLTYHNDLIPFQYGMRSIKNVYDPESEIWEQILKSYVIWDIAKIITKGDSILDYERTMNKLLMDSFAFEGKFLSYNALFVNAPFISTSTFEAKYDEDIHDLMIGFHRNASGSWNVSLRSTKDDIDVGRIAKAQGGGGHKGASGFQTKELWFLE